jgi:hypothetical protein
MITIIDKNTEEVLYSTHFEVELLENEISVDGLSGDFTHYNLVTKEFYNK